MTTYRIPTDMVEDRTTGVLLSEELEQLNNRLPPEVNISAKADQVYVDTELAKKASTTYIDTALTGKADKTAMYSALGNKADVTYVDTQLEQVPKQIYITEKVKKHELVINVKDFGAKGDGFTDDTAAIQAAVDAVNGGSSLVGATGLHAINTIYFPPGDYIVLNTIVISDTVSGGLVFYGGGTARDTRLGARILSTVESGPVFVARKYAVVFNNINFFNKATFQGVGTTGIQMAKLVNGDDAELDVIGCSFNGYEIGVKHEGRSCKVTDGYMVKCKYGISYSWTAYGDWVLDANGTIARPNHTEKEFGFRAFQVINMRFHMCDFAVYNSGRLENQYIRSVLIANNIMDLTGRLFYGALNYATISGNVIDIGDDTETTGKIHISGGGKGITISGNMLGGYRAGGATNAPVRQAQKGIVFDVEAVNCTIVGNTVTGFTAQGIRLDGGANGSVITGNTVYDNTAGFMLSGNFTRSSVVNNATNLNDASYSIGELVADQYSLIEPLGNIPIRNNSTWYNFYGGTSQLGKLSWESAGTNGLTLSSMGGSINLNPDPANNSIRPFTDNLVSLGAGSRRYSVVYAGTATINTSDEREKQQIANINEAALRAWGKVNYVQFKFDNAVEQKGDGARWHFGVIAQRVKEAFESEGLDPFAYGLLCYDEWEDEGVLYNRYGIRYEEALALECAYLRNKIDSL